MYPNLKSKNLKPKITVSISASSSALPHAHCPPALPRGSARPGSAVVLAGGAESDCESHLPAFATPPSSAAAPHESLRKFARSSAPRRRVVDRVAPPLLPRPLAAPTDVQLT